MASINRYQAVGSLGKTLLRIAPFGPAVVSLSFGALLLDQQRRYAQAADATDREHRSANLVNRVYFLLKDLEADQRGYLLTGDQSFLAGYRTTRARLQSELPDLQAIADGDDPLPELTVLPQLAERRLAASSEVIRLREEVGPAAVAAAVAEGEGRHAMQQFEAAATRVQQRAAEQQAARERGLHGRFRVTLWLIIAGTAVSGLAGSASVWIIGRHARQRQAAADGLQVANTQLREQAGLLEQQRDELAHRKVELEDQSLELELQAQDLEETTRLLADREQRFRALVERAADLIIVLDGNRCISYASPPVTAGLARAAESLLGTDISTLIHPADREQVEATLDGLLRNAGSTAEIEARYQTSDGRWRLLAGHVRNLLDDAAVAGIVLNCRDVTQERSVEEQLRQAQKMEAMGLLAGGVAHDFNNLLTSIQGYTTFACESIEQSHPARADLREVLKAAELAGQLTRQLLTFSRQQVTKPEVLDLNTVVENAAGMLRRLLGATIDVSLRLEPALERVLINSPQIQQVILNLAVNARDAMPAGGRLSIETSNVELDEEHASRRGVEAGRYVLLSVTDTGEGIPAELVERIFEPFFTTKEQGRGTGLGLSTSYGIVRQAGGFIWVYSEVGRGTTFKVYLPVVRLDAVPAPVSAPAEQPATGAGASVLLVEDDETVRNFARRTLVQAGFVVTSAANGDEALHVLAADASIRLVITDVIMPGMSGGALGRELANRYPHLKVLYTSGYPRDEMGARGTILPNVAFLEKPYSSTDLATFAARVLRGEILVGGSGHL